IIFKFLITPERIDFFSGFSMFRPFFTRFMFFAIPAKFNSFFLQGTGDKRAASTHSGFGFTSTAPACPFRMVMRAKSAGKPTNAN
ncbi:MAG: hypothetical protein LUQ40_06440, partial [Methanomicrobiales archaeon]|nr:hypothetical protein [Methanomicrobiales archaeon]